MATWIVGGIVVLIVAAVVRKMIRDRRAGRGACSCGGDCACCHGCASRTQEDS